MGNQLNMIKIMKYLFVAYVLIMIVTFGKPYNSLINKCHGNDQVMCNVSSVSGGFLAAAFWPLYWSVSMWDK